MNTRAQYRKISKGRGGRGVGDRKTPRKMSKNTDSHEKENKKEKCNTKHTANVITQTQQHNNEGEIRLIGDMYIKAKIKSIKANKNKEKKDKDDILLESYREKIIELVNETEEMHKQQKENERPTVNYGVIENAEEVMKQEREEWNNIIFVYTTHIDIVLEMIKIKEEEERSEMTSVREEYNERVQQLLKSLKRESNNESNINKTSLVTAVEKNMKK